MMPQHKLFFHELPARSSPSFLPRRHLRIKFKRLSFSPGRGGQKLRGGPVVLGHVAGGEGGRDRQGTNSLSETLIVFPQLGIISSLKQISHYLNYRDRLKGGA